MRLIWIVLLLLVACKPSDEEIIARVDAEEAAAKQRAQAMVDARKSAAAAADSAIVEQQRAAAEKEKLALEASKASLAGMTPAEREQALRDRCSSGCSTETRANILGAASSSAERAKLSSILDGFDAKSARAADARTAGARDRYADSYDTALLERHRNPDSVTASGAGKTTLAVRGWFCSRQFIFDFANGPDGAEAKGLGFKRLECGNAMETWSQDL